MNRPAHKVSRRIMGARQSLAPVTWPRSRRNEGMALSGGGGHHGGHHGGHGHHGHHGGGGWGYASGPWYGGGWDYPGTELVQVGAGGPLYGSCPCPCLCHDNPKLTTHTVAVGPGQACCACPFMPRAQALAAAKSMGDIPPGFAAVGVAALVLPVVLIGGTIWLGYKLLKGKRRNPARRRRRR